MKDQEDPRLIEELRTQFHNPVPKDEIRRRIEATILTLDDEGDGSIGLLRWKGPLRVITAVAASLAIFVGGAEYGRHSVSAAGRPSSSVAGAPPTSEAVGLPISIQTAGSEYVFRLAQLTARSASLTDEDRRIAEEVAWASLRGAATELARLSRDSEALAALIVELERGQDPDPTPSSVIRF